MSIQIQIQQGGPSQVTIDGHSTTISQPTPETAREAAMELVIEHARQLGQAVLATASEGGKDWHLTIHPDGSITTAPHPEPSAAPEIIDVVPVDRTPTRPSPTPEPAPREETAQPLQQIDPEQDGASAAPGPISAPAPAPVVERDPRWEEIAEQPATEGIRGSLNGIGFSLAPAQPELDKRRTDFEAQLLREAQDQARQDEERTRQIEERRQRETRARERDRKDREQRQLIQTNFQGTKTVLIANPKGGARKTTTCYMLAATMGIIRGGSVIAWDANETMGTLGERSHQDLHTRTVVDLLEESAERFGTIEGSRLGVLDKYVRPQGDAHFDVLASDEDPTRQDIVDDKGFATVHEILTRFYRMIFVDTGNNIRVSHFRAALEASDQLVIPVAASRDSARVAQQMMRSLTASGHEDLVRNAVVLIHDLEPQGAAGDDYLETVQAIAAEFEPQVSAVVPVPFDTALKAGDVIDHDQLQPATRRAYQEAAAAIGTALRSTL